MIYLVVLRTVVSMEIFVNCCNNSLHKVEQFIRIKTEGEDHQSIQIQ